MNKNIENFIDMSKIILNKKYKNIYLFDKFNLALLYPSGLIIDIIESFPEKEISYFLENIQDINSVDDDKWSITHYLLYYCHNINLIKKFLTTSKVDLSLVNNKSKSVLHFALKYNDPAIIELIINKINLLEKCDDMHWCPIHYAIRYSTSDIVRLLLEKNIDVNTEPTLDMMQLPIHFVLRYCDSHNDTDIIFAIINQTINLECQDIDGWRPIHYAVRYQPLPIIKTLLRAGVNPCCKTHTELFPIDIAYKFTDAETIKLLKLYCNK